MRRLGTSLGVRANIRRTVLTLGLAVAMLSCLSDGRASAQAVAEQPPSAVGQARVSPDLERTAVPFPETPPARSLDTAGPAFQDLSPWVMFLGADVVVKAVMVGLAFASLLTWTVLLTKSLEFFVARRRIVRALDALGDCHSLHDAETLFTRNGREVVASLVHEAADEAALSVGIAQGGGVRERAAARCTEVIRAESRRLRIGTGLLATIGSTAPFVGLFGTVWGIMNSFVGIARAQTTNLAVVAPGIAEALLATAIGLVAAIPAVIIYNHFARLTKNHLELVNRVSGMIQRLLSRDLDRSRHGSLRLAAE